ncbi:MAG: cyclic nucleotide-binding domain-containing protein [Candidatus Gastranaerophilales bacterium]|nr:cyclic nucleotide-binding domain-containing protein [Candidatus Gastranaerophilales bacterium]
MQNNIEYFPIDEVLASGIPFFYDFKKEDLIKILKFLQVRKISSGRYVFKEGDSPRGMYFILKGSVKIKKKLSQNEEILINELDALNFFGETSLIDGRRCAASVITKSNFEAAELSCENFEKLCELHPKMGLNITKKIAHTVILKLRKISSNKDGII